MLSPNRHELGDRPVPLGHNEPSTRLDLAEVDAQVLAQLPNSDGITHVRKRSTRIGAADRYPR